MTESERERGPRFGCVISGSGTDDEIRGDEISVLLPLDDDDVDDNDDNVRTGGLRLNLFRFQVKSIQSHFPMVEFVPL